MNPVNYYAQRRTVVVRTPAELILAPMPIVRPILCHQTQMISHQTPSVVYFPTTLQQQQCRQDSSTQTADIPATPPPSPAASNKSAANTPAPESVLSAHPYIQVNPNVEIHIGQPASSGKEAPSSAQQNTPADASSNPDPSNAPVPDPIEPPPVPLPMLPAPNGIAIPPPPQETTSAVQSANTQNKKCGSCCCNCGPVNKTYLVYAMIAVCASLVIALVPTLVALLAKPKD